MQANISSSIITTEVIISHKQQTLNFNIFTFGSKNIKSDYDVFAEINSYWSTLPEKLQDDIFQVYSNIFHAFENINSADELKRILSLECVKLIELNDINKIFNWINFKSFLIIPESFKEDYSHNADFNTSREKTYTRTDYTHLLSLSILLRCMLPIWGEYIAYIRQDVGNNHKEYESFKLLKNSDLLKSLPVVKLFTYIDNIVGKGKKDYNNTLKGVSTEDFVYWLLASICVRRLCLSDLRAIDDRINLVTLIYKFIAQKTQGIDVSSEKAYKDKKPEGDFNSESENKISTAERYRLKPNISPGDIAAIEFSASNTEAIAERLCYSINKIALRENIETAQLLINQQILDPQTILLSWVFKNVISPRGIPYINRYQIINCLGALQTVLWERGHKYLALLSTCYPVTDIEYNVNFIDSKVKISSELLDKLESLYPFTKPSNGKKITGKSNNSAVLAIDSLVDKLVSNTWKMTAREEYIEEVFGNKSRRFPIKPDIKTDLTLLAIELANDDLNNS